MINLYLITLHDKTGVENQEVLIFRLSAHLCVSVERSDDDLLSAHDNNNIG